MADLVIKSTPERIDFRIAGLSHFATAEGVTMNYGRDGIHTDSLQAFADAFHAVEIFSAEHGHGGAHLHGRRVGGAAVKGHFERQLELELAGHRLQFIRYHDLDTGIDGAWLKRFKDSGACGRDAPGQMAELSSALVAWAAALGVHPSPPHVEG